MTATTTHATRANGSQRLRDVGEGRDARGVIPSAWRPCCSTPSVTPPLYKATVSQALRRPLRSRGENELRRIRLPRTPVNKPPADVPKAAWWHHVHGA